MRFFIEIGEESVVIVKVDIEGGEEYLLSENIGWVDPCFFLSIEIHDRFHPVMINSSKNIVYIIKDGNFAITAASDVLHLYSREKLEKFIKQLIIRG